LVLCRHTGEKPTIARGAAPCSAASTIPAEEFMRTATANKNLNSTEFTASALNLKDQRALASTATEIFAAENLVATMTRR
jgi:hypothetical protein